MVILLYVKSVLGLEDDNHAFDDELLMFINTAVAKLQQIGVQDLDDVFVDSDTLWPLFSSDITLSSLCKSYVGSSVRLIFDPPANGAVKESYKQYASELEGRIQFQCEITYPTV